MLAPAILLPLALTVFRATPKIIADAHAKILAAREPGSPDGVKVDGAELAGIVVAIAADLAELLLPELEKALGGA